MKKVEDVRPDELDNKVSAFNRGLKLDKIIGLMNIRNCTNFLWKVKWVGSDDVDYLNYEEIQFNKNEKCRSTSKKKQKENVKESQLIPSIFITT